MKGIYRTIVNIQNPTKKKITIAAKVALATQFGSEPDHDDIIFADALEQEQMHLMPMPVPLDGYVEVLAPASSSCLATLQCNRYSAPCNLASQMMTVHIVCRSYRDCL